MNWDSGSSGNGEEINSRSTDVFMRRFSFWGGGEGRGRKGELFGPLFGELMSVRPWVFIATFACIWGGGGGKSGWEIISF